MIPLLLALALAEGCKSVKGIPITNRWSYLKPPKVSKSEREKLAEIAFHLPTATTSPWFISLSGSVWDDRAYVYFLPEFSSKALRRGRYLYVNLASLDVLYEAVRRGEGGDALVLEYIQLPLFGQSLTSISKVPSSIQRPMPVPGDLTNDEILTLAREAYDCLQGTELRTRRDGVSGIDPREHGIDVVLRSHVGFSFTRADGGFVSDCEAWWRIGAAP